MSQSRSIFGAASSLSRFLWLEGIVNRYDVRIRHEHRIIYRVGTPCFDLIISNKRDRNDDFNVSGVCLVVHTTKENIAMKDGSFTRSDQKKERIPADDDD